MAQCQMCDDFYHLLCCGIPTNKHANALEMIEMFGWSCKACRGDARTQRTQLQADIMELQQQLEMLMLARGHHAAQNDNVLRGTASDTTNIESRSNKQVRLLDPNSADKSENAETVRGKQAETALTYRTLVL